MVFVVDYLNYTKMKYYKLLAVFTIMHFTVLAQNESAILIESWKDESWQNKYKTTFEYDIEGNEIVKSYFQWNNDALVWQNHILTETAYDSQGRKLETVVKKWDVSSNDWVYWEIEYIDYDGSLSIESKKRWNGHEWINLSRLLRTVDSTMNVVDETHQSWQADKGDWRNNSRISYTWGKGMRKKEMLTQTMDHKNGEWRSIFKTTFDNTAEKNNVVLKNESFLNGEWTEVLKSENTNTRNKEKTYFPDGRLFQETRSWIGADGNLEMERTTIRY